MRRIKITITYDGTHYNGWQRQLNSLGIEEVIENTICSIFKENTKIIGASRTDAGVHALGQVALFRLENPILVDKIPYAINSKLPDDIKVLKAEEVNENFHPRYSAKNKTYQYLIYNNKFMLPQYRYYMAFEQRKLDIIKMKKALQQFVGTKDFKAFCSAKTSVKDTVRTINCCDLIENNNIVKILINGNGFLYNMVRIIVGTIIEVGLGKREPNEMIEIIKSKDRSEAGITAVAKGLTLLKINY